MSTRTTYTSTIRVPVYAGWKCPCCGETNFSFGNIVCRRSAATSSLRPSKHEEAKDEASRLVQNEWQQNALDIIFNLQKDPQKIRNDLFFQNTNCTKCGKKPKWDKGTGYLILFSLSFFSAIISGLLAISMKTSWIAWLVFAAFLGIILYCIINEEAYKKAIVKMPAEYLPVIGTQNAALLEFAERQGKKLPTPDETIRIVSCFKSVSTSNSPITPAEVKEEKAIVDATAPNDKEEQVCFCRKCGGKIPAGSKFCIKCGTEVMQ